MECDDAVQYRERGPSSISDHDKFEKECEELSNRMLGLLESIAADRFDYLSPNNGQSTSRISCRPR